MKNYLFSLWAGVFGCGLVFFSWSALPNTHEHLTSWFHYEALVHAYEESYQRPFPQIQVRLLTAKGLTDQSQKVITGIWGPQIWQQLIAHWSTTELATTSLQRVSEFIGKLLQRPSSQVLEGFFRFNNANQHNMASYVGIEDCRKSLIKQLRAQEGPTSRQQFQHFFFLASEATIKAQTGVDVHRLDLSISGDLLGPEIKQLAQLLQRYQVRTGFFFAYPRYKLLQHDDATFQRNLQLLTTGHQQGILSGIDLAGSINEHLPASAHFPPAQAAKLRERLDILFHWAQEHQGKIKIHAFESARTGAFYQILFQALEEFQGTSLPINVTWGHVNQVGPADIQRLLRIRQQTPIWHWRFDANFHSARELYSLAASQVGEKIKMLWASGIPVGLGTDGQGIWQTAESDLHHAFYLLGIQRSVPFHLVLNETLGHKVDPVHVKRYQVAVTCQQVLTALQWPIETTAQRR